MKKIHIFVRSTKIFKISVEGNITFSKIDKNTPIHAKLLENEHSFFAHIAELKRGTSHAVSSG